jgi:CRISPR-associated protein Csb1
MKIKLVETSRIIVKTQFESLQSTIQPASFKDVGPGIFKNPATRATDVVIQSPQGTANLLELTCWDAKQQQLLSELEGLPYVELFNKATGVFAASSITLPHRLGSGYLAKHKESDLAKPLLAALNQNPARATLHYCPNTLVHGAFYSHLDNGYKLTRLLNGEIIARDCTPVALGGVAFDPIVSSGEKLDMTYFDAQKGSSVGLGHLPYYKEAFVAKKIEGIFIFDRALLESYQLSTAANQLIESLALFKLYRLLSHPLRIRAGCDLMLAGDPEVSGTVPEYEQVLATLQWAISTCNAEGLFANPPVTRVSLTLKEPNKTSTSKKAAEGNE